MDLKLTNSREIEHLLEAHLPSAALGAALEIGLFWRLSDGPQSADQIAQLLGIPLERCRHWLDLLAGLGLLDSQEEGYSLSPLAAKELTGARSEETWRLLAVEAREAYPAGTDLATLLSHPGSVWEAQGRATPNYVNQMAADPSRARRFTRMLYELHQPLARELGRTLDLSECRRMMDLGGGSGVISLELLRRHPELSAVVVDIENVCDAGREIAGTLSEGERIEYRASNFLADELPSGFDLVLECDVGIHSEGLYRKVHASLEAGGRFIIVDKLPQSEQPTTLLALQEAFRNSLKDPEYRQQTVQDVYAYLSAAGFRPISAQSLSYGRWWVIRAERTGEEVRMR